MKILQVLTYYRPHISGLTIYVERLSRALAEMGHEVTVFTSHYRHDLPAEEVLDGVHISRVPVAFRVSKGVIMPTFGPRAWRMVRRTDIVHLHLPQFDAPGVALRGRLLNKPVVLTYHSDLQLPASPINRVVNGVVDAMNRLAGELADAVVTYTEDFGRHSPFLSRYIDKKLHIIPPPVELLSADESEIVRFANENQLKNRKVIGISARLAAEKGIEILLSAMPKILSAYPEALVLHACPEAIGEQAYAKTLEPLFEQYRANYRVLGPLEGPELAAFYRNLDCLVLCSLNNTETFGLVQIEAMLNGAPVVASDLPGVRQPVRMTGMGEIVPVGDHNALADAICRVLSDQDTYHRPPDTIASCFNPEVTASDYISLYEALLSGDAIGALREPEAYVRLRQIGGTVP